MRLRINAFALTLLSSVTACKAAQTSPPIEPVKATAQKIPSVSEQIDATAFAPLHLAAADVSELKALGPIAVFSFSGAYGLAGIRVGVDPKRSVVELAVCDATNTERCNPSKEDPLIFPGREALIPFGPATKNMIFLRACVESKGQRKCQADYVKAPFTNPHINDSERSKLLSNFSATEKKLTQGCQQLAKKVDEIMTWTMDTRLHQLVANLQSLGPSRICSLIRANVLRNLTTQEQSTTQQLELVGDAPSATPHVLALGSPPVFELAEQAVAHSALMLPTTKAELEELRQAKWLEYEILQSTRQEYARSLQTLQKVNHASKEALKAFATARQKLGDPSGIQYAKNFIGATIDIPYDTPERVGGQWEISGLVHLDGRINFEVKRPNSSETHIFLDDEIPDLRKFTSTKPGINFDEVQNWFQFWESHFRSQYFEAAMNLSPTIEERDLVFISQWIKDDGTLNHDENSELDKRSQVLQSDIDKIDTQLRFAEERSLAIIEQIEASPEKPLANLVESPNHLTESPSQHKAPDARPIQTSKLASIRSWVKSTSQRIRSAKPLSSFKRFAASAFEDLQRLFIIPLALNQSTEQKAIQDLATTGSKLQHESELRSQMLDQIIGLQNFR